MNKTRKALGRARLPPTKVFPRLAVNKTILKPRLAAADVGFSRRNTILRCSACRRKQSGSGIQILIRIWLKS